MEATRRYGLPDYRRADAGLKRNGFAGPSYFCWARDADNIRNGLPRRQAGKAGAERRSDRLFAQADRGKSLAGTYRYRLAAATQLIRRPAAFLLPHWSGHLALVSWYRDLRKHMTDTPACR